MAGCRAIHQTLAEYLAIASSRHCPWLRQACRSRPPYGSSTVPHRLFSTRPPRLRDKKRSDVIPGPKTSKSANLKSVQNSAASKPLEDLNARIDFLTTALRASLSKLRASGTTSSRHSVPVIENTKLEMKQARSGGGGGSSSTTVRIADVAQVVQRARTIQLLIGEEAHVKAVLSAVQSLGLPSPRPLPGQERTGFGVPIPPPTAESRAEVAKEADAAESKSAMNLRNARGDCKKALARLRKENLILPDEQREMEAKMELLVKQGTGEFKTLVEGAKKAILQP